MTTAQDGAPAMGRVECVPPSAATVLFTVAGELPSSVDINMFTASAS